MGDADVADVAVTCILTTYSVGGTVTGAASTTYVWVVLTLSDDNAGAGATKKSARVNADGIFSFSGIPENKFYTLQTFSNTAGETCSDGLTTPTLITANVTAPITCTDSTSPIILISLTSFNYEASLTTINVFIADSAHPRHKWHPYPSDQWH